jgi:glycine/D-amino acid oxidase-like deaminating enzyme
MADFAGRSFWLEADPYVPGPPQAGDVGVDIAIIGGGFTGLWAAHFLLRAEPALKVAVIEREVVGYGASGRNGGFAMTLLSRSLHDLVQTFGTEPARAAHEAVVRSIDAIGQFCAAYKVTCDYEKNGFIGVALDDSGPPRRWESRASVTCPARSCGVKFNRRSSAAAWKSRRARSSTRRSWCVV